jgi:hypothetical protein
MDSHESRMMGIESTIRIHEMSGIVLVLYQYITSLS